MAQQRVDLNAWSQALAEAMRCVGKESFAVKFYEAMAVLAPHDDPVIWVYPKGEKPFAYNGLPSTPMLDTAIDEFLSGPYLLDPYYLAGMEAGTEGFYRLSDLTPRSFRQSEYYRSYYVRMGMVDEAGYLVSLGDNCFANISFCRNEGNARYTSGQLQQLAAVTPVVTELFCQHMAIVQASDMPEKSGSGLHQHLQSALDNFGGSLLTEREMEVIHLFLRGHSTKSAAEKLSISPETIKLHRKNSYAKLDVASQAELFFLFIDSLSNAESQAGEDPLKSYLASPV